jgi:hypothetical protein
MKLGTLLLRNAAISLTQLEAGLRAQVLYGGRLGTNLVELGFLDVDALGAYLGELTQLPVATRGLLDHAAPAVTGLLDAETVERLGVMPLGFFPPAENALALAMIEPADLSAIDEVGQRTGRAIAPYVVPELRLLYYLEKVYGLPRKARFVRTGTRRAPGPVDERRRAQPAGGIVLPPPVRLEPKRRGRMSEQVPSIPAEPAAAPPPPPTPALAYALACDRLDHATTRAQIGELFVELAAGRFGALVVFVVRDGNALGWYGTVGGAPPPRPVEQISLPLGMTSAFQIAHDGHRPYHGPPPSAGHPIESQLWDALGVTRPRALVVAPVLVRARVVNLVYAHALGAGDSGELTETAIGELAELCVRASNAYVRLIQKART